MPTKTLEFVNPLTTNDQELLNNPYPLLKTLREESPVYWSSKDKYWLISGHCEVTAILKDPSFEKQIQNWKHAPNPILVSLIPHVKSISHVAKNWLLNLNPPAHTRVRALLNKAFTGPAIEQLKPTIIDLAQGLLAKASTASDLELMTQFAIPLPVAVIGHMLGVAPKHSEELKHWSTKLAGAAGRNKDLKVLSEAGKAVEQLTILFRPMIEKRRLSPVDDLLSVLVQAEIEGSRLKTDELIANCILLMIGGHETTTNLIGNAVYHLLKNPEQLSKLRANPSQLMTSMIAEVLRFESPAQSAPRIATRDIELAGKKIKSGDMCWLLLGSANRDPIAFDNPDTFDISRQPSNQTVSFGGGIHRCIGASLAEVELEIAMNALLNWRESYTLKSNPVNFKTPFTIRGPEEILLG
jgi:cytochrome P450